MGKFYVVYISNGSLQIDKITEHPTSEEALVAYHGICRTLWNTKDVKKAVVRILDDQLDCWQDHVEVITHETEAEPAAE